MFPPVLGAIEFEFEGKAMDETPNFIIIFNSHVHGIWTQNQIFEGL